MFMFGVFVCSITAAIQTFPSCICEVFLGLGHGDAGQGTNNEMFNLYRNTSSNN
jgi:hypothetical protein